METKVLPNPCYTHENDPICPMPAPMAEMIYKRDIFLKKIIEDSGTCEESLRLLRFLLWENPDVTSVVLNEIMTLVSYIDAVLHPHSALLVVIHLPYLWLSNAFWSPLHDSDHRWFLARSASTVRLEGSSDGQCGSSGSSLSIGHHCEQCIWISSSESLRYVLQVEVNVSEEGLSLCQNISAIVF